MLSLAFFPFLEMFSNALFLGVVQKPGLCDKELNFSLLVKQKPCGYGKKCQYCWSAFLLFPQCFEKLSFSGLSTPRIVVGLNFISSSDLCFHYLTRMFSNLIDTKLFKKVTNYSCFTKPTKLS